MSEPSFAHSLSHLKVNIEPGSPRVKSFMSESLSLFAQVMFLTGGNLFLFMSFWSLDGVMPPDPMPSHFISATLQTGLIVFVPTIAFYFWVSLSNSGSALINLILSFYLFKTDMFIFKSTFENSSTAAPGYPIALQN